MKSAIFHSFIEALLPRICAACNSISNGDFFCSICRNEIEFSSSDAKKSVKTDFLYSGTVQKAIQQAKFGPDQTCAQALVSHWLQMRYNRSFSGDFFPQVQAVCFVPLHWRRRVIRGFDLPSLIARAAAKMIGIPVLDALICKRFDSPLTLSSSRQQRILATQGRYGLRLLSRFIVGKQLLLVDDVVTTGSTLQAAASVLEKAGAVVHQFALAQVSQQKEVIFRDHDVQM